MIDKALDFGRGNRALKAIHRLALPEGIDGGDGLDAELGGGRLCWPEDGEAMPAQSGSSLSGMG